LLSFTSDRDQVVLAIKTLGSTELVERRPDYLGLLLGQASDMLAMKEAHDSRRRSANDADGPSLAAKIAADNLDDLKTFAAMHERDMDDSERDRVRRFTASLADLARLMQQVQGRKHVVFLSRGFDARLMTGQQRAQPREIEGGGEEAQVREILQRTDNDKRWGNTRLQGELRRSLEEMRKADCVIHSIDISGAEVEVRDIAGEASEIAARTPLAGKGAESLFVMAEQTGGTFHQNFNDLGAAMEKVLQATAVTYVLSIQAPPDVEAESGYVPLRVEVRGAGHGEVSARPGYFVGTPPGAQEALRQRLRLAELLIDGRETGSVRQHVLAVPLAGGGACAVVEVDGPSLLTDHPGDLASAEVSIYAFDAKGAIQATARQLVGLDLQAVGERVRATGFKLFAALDLPPGSYEVRALVRNTVSDRFGIATAHLELGAGDGKAAGGAFVEPPGRDWLLVRNSRAERPLAYPFAVGERVVVPAVLPALHAGQPVTVWIEAPAGARALPALVKRADGAVAASRELAV